MLLDNGFRRLICACSRNLILLSMTVTLTLLAQLLLTQHVECVAYTSAVISFTGVTVDFIKHKSN